MAACIVALNLLPFDALAQLSTEWRGAIQGDVRFIVDDEEVPFERLETSLYARLGAKYGKHVRGVADLRFIFTERASTPDFAALTDRTLLDPMRLESDSLYVELVDLGLDGLDLRVGRQQLIWGTADRFHPTSNFNPLDVEDGLEFGSTIAQEMIHLAYRPYVFAGDEDEPWFEELAIEMVLVPRFKPAQLPQSAGLAFTSPQEQLRLATTAALKSLVATQIAFIEQGAEVAYGVEVLTPELSMKNAMYGARVGWRLLGVDMNLSYFRGFDDFPRGERAVVTGNSTDVRTDLTLTYPRIQVLGVDMATSLDWLDGVGLWAEVGITFHDELYVVVDGSTFVGNQTGAVFANGPNQEHEASQFVKATVGMDYTPLPWWYINIQYLHGFVDEFGTDQLEDYLVAGMDFKLFRDKLLLRTFTILNFQDLSWVLFPQIIVMPFNGAEISVGAFFFFGDEDTKFGSPVAGSSTVFTKTRFSF